ncbi:MAG: SDR family NAD(P)-dependent oxidoreductase [Pedobacter sp.]|uniref:SDR family oxidoreductase n=1 Tax=Pedobacter sp. TaxID=1411316 RepID=UPI00339B6E0F
MNLTKNTVLIAGGSAGIGFEIAKLLIEKGNHVIITGRDQARLDAAALKLKDATPIAFDVTKEEEVDELVERLKADFPALNILINNAGLGNSYDLVSGNRAWEKAEAEMQTNYISVLRLTEKLLPHLRNQAAAAVVNVSSIVAIAPSLRTPTYSVSKAAVHSYTELLRLALWDTSVKVFELMPPLVNTEFSKEIGGENGIPATQVAEDLIAALEQDTYEIHVGQTAYIYELSQTSRAEALEAMNQRAAQV